LSGRADFELYLDHDPNGSFIACDGDRPIGLVTTIRYRSSGFIGNLIVAPDHRSSGVGRALMERGLALLDDEGIETVRLDGDPPGIPLYRSLGFVDEWESLRFRTTGRELSVPESVAKLSGRDLPAVAALDPEIFGDDRGRLLRLLVDRAERALWIERDGSCAGFAFLIRTDRGVRIGPGAAADPAAAEALLTAAVAAFPGEPLSVGVPAPARATIATLERLGFEPTPPSLRMVRGRRTAEGRPEQVLAIANGALG
jgi:hypothetical protein